MKNVAIVLVEQHGAVAQLGRSRLFVSVSSNCFCTQDAVNTHNALLFVGKRGIACVVHPIQSDVTYWFITSRRFWRGLVALRVQVDPPHQLRRHTGGRENLSRLQCQSDKNASTDAISCPYERLPCRDVLFAPAAEPTLLSQNLDLPLVIRVDWDMSCPALTCHTERQSAKSNGRSSMKLSSYDDREAMPSACRAAGSAVKESRSLMIRHKVLFCLRGPDTWPTRNVLFYATKSHPRSAVRQVLLLSSSPSLHTST